MTAATLPVFDLGASRVQFRRTQFTSESVSVGHPDKAADQVADAILDAVLAQDPDGRVACEVLLTDGYGLIAGEITAHATIDFAEVARHTLRGIGYTADNGFDADHATIEVRINQQSADIALGVDRDGAGDQGMMFGYAIADTPELMPLPITLAQHLVARQAEVRRAGIVPGLWPDAKSQVTVEFAGPAPTGLSSVVLSTQHDATWDDRQEALQAVVTEHILRPALGDWWDPSLVTMVNPTGRFHTGGPEGDTGLTGRKVIVDTYGGWARHGGGAFSGKDPSKVDRSASYMARYIAKNVVAAGLAHECEVRLGYVIGVADPTMVTVDCKGTTIDGVAEETIEAAVREVFGALTPKAIIAALDLRRPIYAPTAVHGHVGRPADDPPGFFTWERTDKAALLLEAVGAGVGA